MAAQLDSPAIVFAQHTQPGLLMVSHRGDMTRVRGVTRL